MNVKDVMSTEILSLKSEDSVQDLISLMEKHHLHEIPIIDDKKLIGIVNAKKLTERSIQEPDKTKVKNLLSSPPATLRPQDDLDEAAKIMLKTGFRALPVIENKRVLGMLSIQDIVNEISSSKAFRQTRAEAIMSKAFAISDNDDIGKARVLMREHNVSRIPIVDSNGKLKGVVTTFDMLKSIKTKERMNSYSMAAEMDRIMQIPVSSIMNSSPLTADPKATLIDVAELMNRDNASGVIIATNNQPIGIIVLKDLLEFYVSGLKKEGVYYQIIGLSDEDSFITDTANRMIQDTIKKISSVHKITFMFLHVKRHEVGMKDNIKYSVRVRLKTDKKIFISKAWSWDLRQSVDQALDQLERMIFSEKKEEIDIVRKNKLRMKRRR